MRQVAARVHEHRVRGRGLDQGGGISRQDANRVQQEPESGQDLSRRLQSTGDQQQVAHSIAPPLAGAGAPLYKQTRTRGPQRPDPADRRITYMAKVTIQYWAAAKEAAGLASESVEAETLAEALDVIVARRAEDGRLRAILASS